MAAKIECLISAPTQEKASTMLAKLSAMGAEHGEVKTSQIEKRAGMFEEAYIGQFLLTVATSIATGVVANAIWAHLTANKEQQKHEEQQQQSPDFDQPVQIKIDTVNITININKDD